MIYTKYFTLFRWNEAAQELTERLENVVGDALIAAALLAYLGPFTVEYREVIVITIYLFYVI